MKKRFEAEEKDTWKLEDMIESNEAWEALFEEASGEIGKYETFQGHLSDSADMLCRCLKFDDDSERKIERLYVYARMRSDEDTAEQKYQDMFARAQSLSFQAAERSSFIVPEILSMPDELLAEYRRSDNGIRHFDRALEILLEKKEHTLSGDMEMLLAQSYDATQGASQIFNMFNNADVKFPSITGENGEAVAITHGNYISLMENQDRRIRRDAFEGLYSVYRQFSNTLAAAFSANVKQAVFYAKAKKYASSRQYYLAENEVPEEVYDNLVKAVRSHLPKLHRYTALRKKVLGVEELHMYDLYVPMVGEADRHYTFEEAKAIVKEGLAPLGEEYASLLEEGFANRWIDVYENEGKRSGAYSWGTYGCHPYVLLNFHGTLNDVFTLAHEMGHSIHTWYSDRNQPFTYAGYKIFVAEVASTCNEALLIRCLLKKAKDKKEKAYLLNHFLESFRGTLFRQTMFAEFEQEAHLAGAAGESLTAQSLCGKYHRLNEDYFGPEMTVDPQIDYEWERIPHFYTPFYVYQYATGFSAAIAISSRIMRGEEGALEGYKKFLSGGCSMKPVELLKLCGVDMSSSRPVDEALAFFEELLDEFEACM
ncbi:oligoendopeptidase F [Lacrimispora sp. 210928-DFI.3.58]|uniref:oligoendopeptidase F n=1 Tax=Lacrimispora sp. 210928-DFI.3.58 TaxID=2883214 RepID=UPI001D068D3F|nr:oligoendopeptidase F [Lacrimispora sp. 210928-DFI.3.58]MCB7319395.1 oligoendopeptidase F [Lacrimispora sp. 210928-DFI.3.58]